MAGGGYRGIPAAVPPAQYLRSASGKGATDQNQKPKQRQINSIASRLAHSRSGYIRGKLVGWQATIAAMRRPDKPATKNQRPSALPFTTQQAER